MQPIDAAYLLSNVVPHLISVEFDAGASSVMIQASLTAMISEITRLGAANSTTSLQSQIHVTRSDWARARDIAMQQTLNLQARSSAWRDADASAASESHTTSPPSRRPHGSQVTGSSPQMREAKQALLPPDVPALPKGYIVREALLAGIKSQIMHVVGPSDSSEDPSAAQIVTAHGMGGSGKTVIASALCNDVQVRSFFQKICFVGVGQAPEMRQLQASLYRQLVGKPLDPSFTDDAMVFNLLQEAARSWCALLVIDDAWELAQVRSLACLGASTRSAVIVTTRIQKLVPSSPQFPLGVLDPDTAIALMLETAGQLAVPPYESRLYAAVEACGCLPLTLAVAGSMLEQLGGHCNDEFLRLLTEDRGEALREGEVGDMHVKVEDRIITATLENYRGGESELVRALFFSMAIFPEDVPVPASLFDLLATSFFGASGRRPQLQIRSWLTALVRLSLVIGSMADGVFMHDIVRDYAMSRCPDLKAKHRHFLHCLLEAEPEGGWPSPWMAGQFGRETPARYVCVHLKWHVKNTGDGDEAEGIVSRLVAYSPGCAYAVCSALGEEAMGRRCDAAEAAGQFLNAGRYANGVATLHKRGDDTVHQNMENESRLIVRGVQLLAKADDDDEANKLELQMLVRASQLWITACGVFDDAPLMLFLNQRKDVLSERRKLKEGHTYEFLRDESSLAFGTCFGEIFAAFEKMTATEGIEGRYGWECGLVLPMKLELLPRCRSEPERLYTVSSILLYLDVGGMGSARVRDALLRRSGFGSIDEILEAMGGKRVFLETLGAHKHYFAFRREGCNDFTNFWGMAPWTNIALRWGIISACAEFVEGRASIQRQLEESRRQGETFDVDYMNLWYLWSCSTRAYTKQGLPGLARRVATDVMGFVQWSDVLTFFDDTWYHISSIHGKPRVGTRHHNWTVFSLDLIYLGVASVDVEESEAGDASGDRASGGESISKIIERVTNDVDGHIKDDWECFLARSWSPYSTAEAAALVCEQRGLDEQAERYATYVVNEYAHTLTHCQARLVLGRLRRKIGDAAAALEHFQRAADVALAGDTPLLALHIGRVCGGAEGERIVDKAVAAIGRPKSQLLTEVDVFC